MDLWTALLTVIRRWYISVPILLLGIIATFAVGARIQPKYQTESSIILVAPNQQRDDQGIVQPWQNSFMKGSGVRGAGAALVTRLGRTSLINRFESFGYATEFFVAQSREGDTIVFGIVGDSEQQTLDTAQALMDEARTSLQQIQLINLGAPEAELIRVEILTEPDEVEEQSGSRTRVMAMVALLSIAAAGAASILIENLSERRRAKTLADAPTPAPQDPATQPSHRQTAPPLGPVEMGGVTYVPVMTATAGGVATSPVAVLDHDEDDNELETQTSPGNRPQVTRRKPTVLDNGRRADSQRPRTGEEDADQLIDLVDDSATTAPPQTERAHPNDEPPSDKQQTPEKTPKKAKAEAPSSATAKPSSATAANAAAPAGAASTRRRASKARNVSSAASSKSADTKTDSATPAKSGSTRRSAKRTDAGADASSLFDDSSRDTEPRER